MSLITSSSLNVTMMRVEGFAPTDIFKSVSAGLSQFVFKDISETIDEQSVGWVHIEDRNKTDFDSPALLHINEFVFLSVRRDVRKIPSAVLNEEIQARSAAWLSDRPNMRRPPKAVREDIRNTAKLSLLSKTLPVPKVVHAVWNTANSTMIFLSASNSDIDVFADLFHRTFDGLRLVEKIPFGFAESAALLNRSMHDELLQADQSKSDNLLDKMHSNRWIGEDFAMWILADMCGTIPGLSLWVDDKLVLSSDQKKAVFSGERDGNMAAIRAAVIEGKRLTDVRVSFESNEGLIWSTSFNTETFRLKGLKIPPVKVEYSEESVDMLQAEYLVRVGCIMDAVKYLFFDALHEFLQCRLIGETFNPGIEDFLES